MTGPAAGRDADAAGLPADAVPCPVCDGHGSLLRSGDGLYFEACWACRGVGRVPAAAIVAERRLEG